MKLTKYTKTYLLSFLFFNLVVSILNNNLKDNKDKKDTASIVPKVEENTEVKAINKEVNKIEKELKKINTEIKKNESGKGSNRDDEDENTSSYTTPDNLPGLDNSIKQNLNSSAKSNKIADKNEFSDNKYDKEQRKEEKYIVEPKVAAKKENLNISDKPSKPVNSFLTTQIKNEENIIETQENLEKNTHYSQTNKGKYQGKTKMTEEMGKLGNNGKTGKNGNEANLSTKTSSSIASSNSSFTASEKRTEVIQTKVNPTATPTITKKQVTQEVSQNAQQKTPSNISKKLPQAPQSNLTPSKIEVISNQSQNNKLNRVAQTPHPVVVENSVSVSKNNLQVKSEITTKPKNKPNGAPFYGSTLNVLHLMISLIILFAWN